ncbi:MAG: hypothetical protein ACD_76C00055G0001 [uncultured bacterium]|nr:MAG: hypothetical protein ACD_76C00055G0001 [uncultured bacterium]HBD05646.1 hypothetical protein [Candidatus Uhrbacteria bacterium]
MIVVLTAFGFLMFTQNNKTGNKRDSEASGNLPAPHYQPSPEEEAWAQTHLQDNWNDIANNYPIPSVREAFGHVLDHINSGEVIPNISPTPNAAGQDVQCAVDINELGRQRMNFYLPILRTLSHTLNREAFQDNLINCMVHENVHLEKQPIFSNPRLRFSREAFARTEAEAWCITAELVLIPMRNAGRGDQNDLGSKRALSIFDQVGGDCDDPLWIAFGWEMSPPNPEYNYME